MRSSMRFAWVLLVVSLVVPDAADAIFMARDRSRVAGPGELYVYLGAWLALVGGALLWTALASSASPPQQSASCVAVCRGAVHDH